LHAVDVDHPFLPVDLCDLALSSLVLAPHDPYLVVFADGYRPCLVCKLALDHGYVGRKATNAVFVSELFRERRGHDFSAHG
jgi:hypothetical protein